MAGLTRAAKGFLGSLTNKSDSTGFGALPRGAAPDRTNYSLLRYAAPKGTSTRFQNLIEKYESSPELAEDMLRIVRKGEDVGRKWYDTEGVRSKFISVLGEAEGHSAWEEYMDLIGATSTGSKVEPNLRNASYYFSQNKPGHNSGLGALTLKTDELLSGDLLPKKGSGFGHKMQRNQAKNVGNYYADEWGATADQRLNPKPRGFAQSLKGSLNNIAADKHFMRLMAKMSDDPAFLHGGAEMSAENISKLKDQFGGSVDKFLTKRMVNGKPAYNFNAKAAVLGSKKQKNKPGKRPIPGMMDFLRGEEKAWMWDDMPKDNEYASFEKFVNNLANSQDMTGPQLQASFWMGAAQDTGVAKGSQFTFDEIFNSIVKKRAVERGVTEDQVFKDFATRVKPLAVPLAAGGALASEAFPSEEQPLDMEFQD